MTIDLDYLESTAKAATQGPWLERHEDVYSEVDAHVAFCPTVCSSAPERCISKEQAESNAAYIAAANPAVVLELIAELRAKNDLLEKIFDDCGDKNNGACPVCSTYTHKHWCWYPHLAKMLGKPLDGHDERFFALDNALRTAAKNKTD